MYKWDKLSKQEQDRLRNFQIAREEQWKEDLLTKVKGMSPENLTPFNDVVDESAQWFSTAVEKYMEQVLDDTETRSRMPEWMYQVWNLGPDRLAYIVVRSAMEMIYSSAIFKDDSPLNNVFALPTAQGLGRDIANKCWDVAAWLQARRDEPFYYRYQSKYFKNWSDKRRRAFTKKVGTLPKATMSQKDNFGHAMVRLGIDSGMLVSYTMTEKATKQELRGNKLTRRLYVTLNADLVSHMMSQIDEYSARLMPSRLPMVSRPVAYKAGVGGKGGLQSPQLRNKDMFDSDDDRDDYLSGKIRTGCNSNMSYTTLGVINSLQNTEWRINTQILEVVNDLWKAGRETGTIPSYDQGQALEMPDFPELGSKTEQHEWMTEKARRWGLWAKNEASRLQMSLRMHEAYKLKPFTLWHAYFVDFRGRYYSDSYLMHPQGADIDKALLMADEPVDVQQRDIYWIKVNLANLMGVDKVSFDDRVKYVDERMDDWRAVAADPHGTTELWEDDAPKKNASFQRLAAIFDLIMAIDEGKSQVPVQLDGACNGIQHWAAMTRDENIGPQVNLTPTDKPNDVYQLVADGCTDLCATQPNDWRNRFLQHYEGMIPRKVVKRSVMCDPYGISDHSVRQYVLSEKHLDWVIDLPGKLEIHQATSEMGQLIIASKDVQMQHCNHGKKYVQLLCGWASDEPMVWVSPSGYRVINMYREQQLKASKLQMWEKQFKITYNYYTKEYCWKTAASAMPPNFVHSLDAAHMSLCVDDLSSKGIEFFSMIHDSYGVMAPYVPMLRDSIKETFHAIHKTDQLEYIKECAEGIVGQSLPDQHPARKHEQRGCLDIDSCLEADYLFG